MDEFKYVFNSKKLTDSEIRGGLVLFLKRNGQNIFDELGYAKFNQLFEEQDVASFLSNLNNTEPYWKDRYTRFMARK